jgi:hypothetical protein
MRIVEGLRKSPAPVGTYDEALTKNDMTRNDVRANAYSRMTGEMCLSFSRPRPTSNAQLSVIHLCEISICDTLVPNDCCQTISQEPPLDKTPTDISLCIYTPRTRLRTRSCTTNLQAATRFRPPCARPGYYQRESTENRSQDTSHAVVLNLEPNP